MIHGDFVGTCEDGPDCDHPTNAENPVCKVTCEDCLDVYNETLEACGTVQACVDKATDQFNLCLEENKIDSSSCPVPEPPVVCEDCQDEYLAAVAACDTEPLCIEQATEAFKKCLVENNITECPVPE